MGLFKRNRRFYIKVSGQYLVNAEHGYIRFAYINNEVIAKPYTDKEYAGIKHILPDNHTLELVK